VTLYLQSAGKLSFNQTTSTKGFEEYTSDPAKPVPYTEGIHSERTTEYMDDDQRFAAKRTDVLTFETDTLRHDMTVAGPLLADLMVSISTTDADLVVKLIDVFPDNFKYSQDDKYIMGGYQMLVRGDVIRGKYRNSLSDPKPFVPGKITEVKYALNDVAHVFKKGHRIMVQVQSSWFPLVDRNPQQFLDIYRAKESDFIKSIIRIYTSKDAASKMILPVITN
jgi:putative CocE/NonD family hydrolase